MRRRSNLEISMELRVKLLMVLLLVGMSLACSADRSEQEGETESFIPQGDEFLVVVLPDTQIYAQSFAETFQSQLQWIAEHAEEYNIVFVSHVGDIVQSGNAQSEWDVAVSAFDWIEDIGLPHGFSVGAHDIWVYGDGHDNSCATFDHFDCEYTDYLRNFGPQHYEGRSWFGGSSPSGISSFQRISAGGMDIIFLHLPQDTPEPELEWADEILDANPGTLVHLTTHRYLFDYRLTEELPAPLDEIPAGRFNGLTYLLADQKLIFKDGVTADDLFEQFIARHPNIFAVHCGHVDGEFKQVSKNEADLPVYEILVDYQELAGGGEGWLRLLKFKPSDDEVKVFTLSTLNGELRPNGAGFDHAIQILQDYMGSARPVIEGLGYEMAEYEQLLQDIRTEGSQQRDDYYRYLYEEGERDSSFTLSVPFQSYIDASR